MASTAAAGSVESKMACWAAYRIELRWPSGARSISSRNFGVKMPSGSEASSRKKGAAPWVSRAFRTALSSRNPAFHSVSRLAFSNSRR